MKGSDAEALRLTALRGTFWSGVAQTGQMALRLLVFLILARLLLPSAFGLVALAGAAIDFIQLFMNQGLAAAIVQRDRLDDEHLDSAFWGNIAFAIVLGSATFALAGSVADWLGEPAIRPVIRALSPEFLTTALSSVQMAILRRHLRFKELAVRTLGGLLVGGAVAISLAFAGAGVWSLVAFLLVTQSVGAVLLWTSSEWRPRLRFSLERYGDLFSFGVTILGVHLLTFFRGRADHLLIGGVLGATDLGYYSMARQATSGLATIVQGSIGTVAWSTFSRLQREPTRLAKAIYQVARMEALLTWPVYLGLVVIAGPLVRVVFGERWETSVGIVQAFSVAGIAINVTGLNLTAITALGETRWRVVLEVVIAVVSLGAMAFALPFGITAVGWAYAMAMVAILPLQLWATLRLLPVTWGGYLACFATPAAGSLLMLVAIFALDAQLPAGLGDWPRVAAIVPAGAFVYFAFVLLFARETARDVRTNLVTAIRGSIGSS